MVEGSPTVWLPTATRLVCSGFWACCKTACTSLLTIELGIWIPYGLGSEFWFVPNQLCKVRSEFLVPGCATLRVVRAGASHFGGPPDLGEIVVGLPAGRA